MTDEIPPPAIRTAELWGRNAPYALLPSALTGKHSRPREGIDVSGRECKGGYGGSGMGGIQGFPARALWMAVRTWAPCLAAVEM